ncbi:MAG TPA: hypothetical protein VMT34_15470, partial [Aggregatilineales bacterium]|nr:hypothetical protein [Aggregatilineales bacterium]
MTLTHIGVFIFAAIGYKFIPSRWRGWVLLIGSVLAIYWLQPPISVRPIDFALPTATLFLTLIGWLLTKKEPGIDREGWWTIGVLGGLILLVVLVGGVIRLTPSQPPNLLDAALPLIGATVVVVTSAGIVSERDRAIPLYILLILALFVILKADGLTQDAA